MEDYFDYYRGARESPPQPYHGLLKPVSEKIIKTNNMGNYCEACDTRWGDDFSCRKRPEICMNCCSCAYGMTVYDKETGKCIPVEQPKNEGSNDNSDDSDLPF